MSMGGSSEDEGWCWVRSISCVGAPSAPWLSAGTSPLRRALSVAEPIDDRTPSNTVEGIRIQVVAVEEVAAKSVVVPKERCAAPPRIRTSHVFRDVMAGVEHECGVTLDADIADAEKQGAR